MKNQLSQKSLALTFLIPLLFDGYGRFPERKLRRIPLLREGDPKPRDPEEKKHKKKSHKAKMRRKKKRGY